MIGMATNLKLQVKKLLYFLFGGRPLGKFKRKEVQIPILPPEVPEGEKVEPEDVVVVEVPDIHPTQYGEIDGVIPQPREVNAKGDIESPKDEDEGGPQGIVKGMRGFTEDTSGKVSK